MTNIDIPYHTITLKITIVKYPDSIVPSLNELNNLAMDSGRIIAMHEQHHNKKPVLLVLSVGARVIIFQLLDLRESSETFGHFFEDSQIIVGYKVKNLKRYGWKNYYDLTQFQTPAMWAYYDNPERNNLAGLEKLSGEVLGVLLPEYTVALEQSVWYAPVLTEEQVKYVSLLAYFSHTIYWRMILRDRGLSY